MLVTLYVPFYTSLTHYLTKWLIYSITIIVSLPYIQSEFVSIYFPRYKVTTRMCNAWRTVVVHRFIIYLFLINLFFILLSFPCLRKCCANIWLRYVSQWFSGCWYRPLSARNAGPGQIKTANASIYRKSGRVCCSDTLCRAREHTAFVRVLSLSFSLLSLVSNTTGKEREREQLHHKTEDVLHTNGDIEKEPHCASASNISEYFVTRVSLGLTFADHYIRFFTILIFCYRLLRLHDLAAWLISKSQSLGDNWNAVLVEMHVNNCVLSCKTFLTP